MVAAEALTCSYKLTTTVVSYASYESLRGLKGAIQIGLKEQPTKIQNCSDSAMAGVAADAEALFKAKRFADSLPLFDEHIQKNPNDKVGFCNRAQVHIEMK